MNDSRYTYEEMEIARFTDLPALAESFGHEVQARGRWHFLKDAQHMPKPKTKDLARKGTETTTQRVKMQMREAAGRDVSPERGQSPILCKHHLRCE